MCLYPKTLFTKLKDGSRKRVTVSCGHCFECLRAKSFEWAFRILDECSCHNDNAFITLTYNNDNLPSDGSVSRREVQLFMKLLRKKIAPLRVRFFASGEYGRKFGRPHYHFIIFGWFPSDCYFFQRDGGVELFRSPLLESVWKKGFSSVGHVTYDSALYCAKYMNKFQFDDFKRKNKFPAPVSPPFVQMSNRPGIGFDCVYRVDLKYDRIYRSGKSTKIPRYYLKVMERDGIYLDDFKELRQKQGEMVANVTNLDLKRKKYDNMFLRQVVLK